MIAYPQCIALQPQFQILNLLFSILLPQISFIKPQSSNVNSSSSILTQKYTIFDSKCSQNGIISDKMSASAACAACTACSFFQVCTHGHKHTKLLQPWPSNSSKAVIKSWCPVLLCDCYLKWSKFQSYCQH